MKKHIQIIQICVAAALVGGSAAAYGKTLPGQISKLRELYTERSARRDGVTGTEMAGAKNGREKRAGKRTASWMSRVWRVSAASS